VPYVAEVRPRLQLQVVHAGMPNTRVDVIGDQEFDEITADIGATYEPSLKLNISS